MDTLGCKMGVWGKRGGSEGNTEGRGGDRGKGGRETDVENRTVPYIVSCVLRQQNNS